MQKKGGVVPIWELPEIPVTTVYLFIPPPTVTTAVQSQVVFSSIGMWGDMGGLTTRGKTSFREASRDQCLKERRVSCLEVQ